MIYINHNHVWSIQDRFKYTPYMRDLMLYGGQQDNYQSSCQMMETYLRVQVDDSQLNRLCMHYGSKLDALSQSLEEGIIEAADQVAKELSENEVVYAMFDGCMLPTRPHQVDGEQIGSWKEMKLGRIFREGEHLSISGKPNVIRSSLYVSHFGGHQAFTEKLSVVVDPFEKLNEGLVCINDGATWIANFIKDYYPNATDILDFYHAAEYLHEFSKAVFSRKEQKMEAKKWVDDQLLLLLNNQVGKVVKALEQMEVTGKVKLAARQKILTYYQNNQHRMLYKSYRDRGLLIGSGPIESAHRFVLQKRMKQSGQKWTKKGGQAVSNLRIFHLNRQWDKVLELINQDTNAAA